MKIICTEREKKILISAIRDSTICTFLNREERCTDQGWDCDECVEKSIEWDVRGGDGDGQDDDKS